MEAEVWEGSGRVVGGWVYRIDQQVILEAEKVAFSRLLRTLILIIEYSYFTLFKRHHLFQTTALHCTNTHAHIRFHVRCFMFCMLLTRQDIQSELAREAREQELMRMKIEMKASSAAATSNIGLRGGDTGDRSTEADGGGGTSVGAGSDESTSLGEEGYWDAGDGRVMLPKIAERVMVGQLDERRGADSPSRRSGGKRQSNPRSPVGPASRV